MADEDGANGNGFQMVKRRPKTEDLVGGSGGVGRLYNPTLQKNRKEVLMKKYEKLYAPQPKLKTLDNKIPATDVEAAVARMQQSASTRQTKIAGLESKYSREWDSMRGADREKKLSSDALQHSIERLGPSGADLHKKKMELLHQKYAREWTAVQGTHYKELPKLGRVEQDGLVTRMYSASPERRQAALKNARGKMKDSLPDPPQGVLSPDQQAQSVSRLFQPNVLQERSQKLEQIGQREREEMVKEAAAFRESQRSIFLRSMRASGR
eukprot:NODE_2244_length_1167_cov_17.940966_g1861_i0.p1 GENE.NODE_2244_length_1167_cov_17.940966_g1861_i0~~NODE_2244_length_1167_cov_17.940966_g1861_i0.p1  ORF type:complete len:267 (+),score=40.34 NODE_2244_length_1167_cov_17.940966_g1861_i0:255-1055(+)